MNDLLSWISRNNDAAFFLGIFILLVLGGVAHFFVKIVQAITGHYPTVTTVACNCEESDDEDEEDGA